MGVDRRDGIWDSWRIVVEGSGSGTGVGGVKLGEALWCEERRWRVGSLWVERGGEESCDVIWMGLECVRKEERRRDSDRAI